MNMLTWILTTSCSGCKTTREVGVGVTIGDAFGLMRDAAY